MIFKIDLLKMTLRTSLLAMIILLKALVPLRDCCSLVVPVTIDIRKV
jgi:hypothetical protein